MKNTILWFSGVLSVLGIILIIYFAFDKSFNDGSGIINPETASNFGSFISGIVGSLFTLVGFLLLYQTILEQRKQFNIQQFESKLFELIKYHRENVSEISYTPSTYKEEKEIFGRNVFIDLKKQYLDLYKIIKEELSPLFNIQQKDDKIKIINIAYILFFFGVSERTKETTQNALVKSKLLNNSQADDIIKKISVYKTKYNQAIVFYGGHQSKLGFYFRHIYRTIKFIDEYEGLNEKQKKYYAKMFRVQFTNYEQALFFINSLSDLGKAWREDKNGLCLIENYELIKNIPPKFLGEIDVKEFYPKINYEFS